jgi:ssDNA-binding Zn-finger/Zn-ribbon topoisomerase 1
MRKIKEIGVCPHCECSLTIFKTSNYKRFVKCEACGMSYALPKRGKISNSAIQCPKSNFPVLIVEKEGQKAYFWVDQPCFSCISFDKCEIVKELEEEFKELEVYGY